VIQHVFSFSTFHVKNYVILARSTWCHKIVTFVVSQGNLFRIIYISVNLVHNAQVCYFNNVWFMFLVFLKNFLSFQTTVGPPPRSFAFLVLYPVDPPKSEGIFVKPNNEASSKSVPSSSRTDISSIPLIRTDNS
jgi:hypothetical protein